MQQEPGSTIDRAQQAAPLLGIGPAAVLLLNLEQRMVVHADTVAAQLAPGVRLPVDLDTWADAALLRDLDGKELSGTSHPLSRIMRAEAVMGQAVTAGRGSDLGHRREALWVVGLQLADSTELHDHALVVLVPMADAEAAENAGAATEALSQSAATEGSMGDHALRDRALMASGLAFTVADARKQDQPLVWVNPAFSRTTGYTFAESVGRNCRFLQGELTDRAEVDRLRAALDEGVAITTTLLNYTKDGIPFWNQVTINPVFNGDGELTHFVGIQGDVTGRIEADRQRDEALAAESRARRDAEAAQARLRLLAEATTSLSGTLDLEECRARLIDLVVPDLGDWAMVLHLDPDGTLESISHHHRDPDSAPALARLVAGIPGGLQPGPVQELLLGGAPGRRVNDLDSPDSLVVRSTYVRDTSLLEQTARLGSRSMMFASLPGREGEDVLVLARDGDRTQFDDDDVEVAVDLGRRAGLILDNARLFAIQHRIAETLQKSLLPDLPRIPGVSAAARYHAAESGADVGGDFYELIALPGGRIGFAVGDVVGHDILAAAAMGHLRGMLRACAYRPESSPASVLEGVDTLMAGLHLPTVATAAYGEVEQTEDGWRLSWSSAGHPWLVVREPDGTIDVLAPDTETNDVMLGISTERRRSSERLLVPGSLVIGYTDGLIERRGEALDVGMTRLARAVGSGPHEVSALCDHLVSTLSPGSDDDIVVFALELGATA